MGRYRAEKWVPKSPEQAFDLWVDPVRAPQWSEALIGVFDLSGEIATPGTTYRLDYGPALKRTVTVLTSRRGEVHRVRTSGAGWSDEWLVTFAPEGDGTRIACDVDVKMGWGWLGRLYEKRLGREGAEAKLRAELDRFAEVAQRSVPAVAAGTLMSADCGAGQRVIQILADDDDVLHIRLFAGVVKNRPVDSIELLGRPPSSVDPLTMQALAPPISSFKDIVTKGQPLLALDGGHGVPHIAILRGAFADARPETIGVHPLDPGLLDEVDAWRLHADTGLPLAGRDVEFSIGALVSYAAEGKGQVVSGYGVAKILKVEGMTVHLRLYSDVWKERPQNVNPWALTLAPAWSDRPGIGHMPVSMSVYFGLAPVYMRLAMVGSLELAGYKEWKAAGGRKFGLRDLSAR